MIITAIGFVLGAWLLQQQAILPSVLCWIVPLLLLTAYRLAKSKSTNFNLNNRLLKNGLIFLTALCIGFCLAATFAHIRLSDELPKNWQQKSITLIGVISSLPEQTEHGERFEFDVDQVLTKADDSKSKSINVPKHISLSFYSKGFYAKTPFNPANSASSVSFLKPISQFHAGQRWQFSVKLKRPHGTYNPHGFDFEAWALAQNIRATGTISNKSGNKKLQNFVFKPTYIVEYCREKIGNRISHSLAGKAYAGVIRALVVGDDSQISTDNWTVYLRTGTNHLMSINYLLKHKF